MCFIITNIIIYFICVRNTETFFFYHLQPARKQDSPADTFHCLFSEHRPQLLSPQVAWSETIGQGRGGEHGVQLQLTCTFPVPSESGAGIWFWLIAANHKLITFHKQGLTNANCNDLNMRRETWEVG